MGGLIPACAGKTVRKRQSPHREEAHPRVCGENSEHETSTRHQQGSSPRVRGKPSDGVDWLVDFRLIPACAGKTLNDLEF